MLQRFKTSRSRTGALLALAAALCLGAAVSATAAVYVYSNGFSRSSDVRELKRTSGSKKVCDIALRKKSETVRIITRKDKLCGYEVPVFADRSQPDHEIVAKGKIANSTPRSQRKAAYLAVRARDGGGDYYEFLLKPKTGRYILDRSPSLGALPIKGRTDKAKPIGDHNSLRLKVTGAKVTGHVNGTKVVTFADPNPGQVEGRSASFGIGSTKDSKKVPNARFKQVRVGVPNP